MGSLYSHTICPDESMQLGSSQSGKYDDLFDELIEEEVGAAKQAVQKGGVAGFAAHVNDNKDKWSQIPLNVGFIGNSGCGKSSTINSTLGLRASDIGAAAVGSKQTTLVPEGYPHPQNKSLILWDLPGVGTPDFPKDTYFEEIGFKNFDFFIVLAAMRFREEDVWIGKEIENIGKKFFYVRTMIDNDVRNNAFDKGWSKERTMEEVREDVEENIKKQDLKHMGAYLISNRNPTDYDFPQLMEGLVKYFPTLKQDALVLSLRAHSEALVQAKVEILRKRIFWMSTLSASVAALPIPGVGLAADIAVIAKEVHVYYQQLGLSEASLTQLGLITGVDGKKLIGMASTIYPARLLGEGAIKASLMKMSNVAARAAIIESSKLFTITSSVISSAMSFATVNTYLHRSLAEMQEAANRIPAEAVNQKTDDYD